VLVLAGLSTREEQPPGFDGVQLRPAPVMAPAPVPVSLALRGHVLGSNRAVTAFALLTSTVHAFGVPVTGVQPVQLLNTEFASGVAVSVTTLYEVVFPGLSTDVVQPALEPVVQESPEPVIVPTPVPDVAAVTV
jgi:hypothetical protein